MSEETAGAADHAAARILHLPAPAELGAGDGLAVIVVRGVADEVHLRVVDRDAVELAALRATPAEIAALERPLKSLASLPPAEAARLDLNRDFHLVIARAARNSLIEEMMNSLVARCNEIGFREMLDVDDFAKLLRIHQPIFDAIVARDPQAARTAMIGHFNELRRTIGEI